MICLLCFGVERDELFIDITSEEGRRFDIASIIHRYFDNCFQVSNCPESIDTIAALQDTNFYFHFRLNSENRSMVVCAGNVGCN